ncbi:MAG: RHS repeat-associated core domain-containing protein [Steroidobacteraceae bacterium]
MGLRSRRESGLLRRSILPNDVTDSVYFSYDNQGRMLSALYGGTAGNGITETYDGLGRLQTRTVFGKQIGYAYDVGGRLVQLTYSDGYAVSYGYTNANELQSVVDSTGATLATYSYDALGGLLQISRPNNTGYSHTGIEQLAGLAQDLSGTSYDTSASFAYNPAGQIVSKTQSNDAAYTWLPNPPNSTISASYDDTNRLATFNGANVVEDANGDVQTGVNGMSYAYDALGQLRQATSSSGTVSLTYGPLGLLHTETNGGTTTEYLYDGSNLIAEYVNGTLTDRFVYGSGPGPLVWYQGSGTSAPIYLHADERGSIITASNANGVATGSVKYSSYGESASLVSPFGYAGQLYLPDLQLYYDRARMYSPQTGRFMQPDPAGYASDMNLYAYVSGDPVNAADFSGMTTNDDCAAAGLPCNGALPPSPGYVTQTVTVSGRRCDEECLFQELQVSLDQFQLWILLHSGSTAYLPPARSVAPNAGTGGATPQTHQPINCGTALPDQSTVGSHVSSLSNGVNNSVQFTSTPYGPVIQLGNGSDPYSVASRVYSGTNFRSMYGGPNANYVFLGNAGNFAYGAVSADIGVPQWFAELVAGVYSLFTHSAADRVGPYGMDESATASVPAGYSAQCKK